MDEGRLAGGDYVELKYALRFFGKRRTISANLETMITDRLEIFMISCETPNGIICSFDRWKTSSFSRNFIIRSILVNKTSSQYTELHRYFVVGCV